MSDTQAFLQAVQSGQLETLQRMLADDPALAQARTDEGLSAVLLAAYYGQPQVARLLAAQRTDLNIFEACAVGDQGRVEVLLALDAGAVNAVAPDGFQPLGLAAFFAHPEVARLLVGRGAQVNAPSHNGARVMPLHSATASRSLEIARLLLAHGADPNARQAGDFTPLHNAAQNGQVEMIELLLSHGAALDPRDAKGRTALDFALDAGHTTAAGLLRAHGGGD